MRGNFSFLDSPFLYILLVKYKYNKRVLGALLLCCESVREFFCGGIVFWGEWMSER